MALGLAVCLPVCHEALGIVAAPAKGEQVRQTLNAIHEMSLEIGAAGDEVRTRTAAEGPGKQRHANPEGSHKGQIAKSQMRVELTEENQHSGCNDHRHQWRSHHTHVEIFQGFHVCDDAGEQIARVVLHQSGRGERLQCPIEPGPEAGQQTKSHIVGDEAFGVAENTACDPEETHSNNRDL